jgi:hypothetical protein
VQRALLAFRYIAERVLELETKETAGILEADKLRAPSRASRAIDQVFAAAAGMSCELHAARALVQAIVDNSQRMLLPGYRPDYAEFNRIWPEYPLSERACTRAAEAWASLTRRKRVNAWKPTASALVQCGLGYRTPETLMRECSGWIRRAGSSSTRELASERSMRSPHDTLLNTNGRVLEDINAHYLAMHRRIEAKLRRTPALLEAVRKRVATPEVADEYVEEWHQVLAAGLNAVLAILTEDSMKAAALRFHSPFRDLLTPQEHLEFRSQWRRTHPLSNAWLP